MMGRSSLAAGADRHLSGGAVRWFDARPLRRALTVPSTWMTPPSVIIPRSANELKKAKQLSGTASASNKSKFMAKSVCLWLRRPTEF